MLGIIWNLNFLLVKKTFHAGPGRNRISVSHAAIHNTNHISTELIRTSSTTSSSTEEFSYVSLK